MERAASYEPWRERPRLTVVHAGAASYSALPHAVLFSGLSDGAVRLYAVLQSHWWGESGECTASHATLAAETGKKERTIRALLTELVAANVVAARHLGRGQAKAYRPAEAGPSGRNLPVESGDILPVTAPKRQKSASQAAKIGQFKRQKSAAPIEEDKEKKIQEEDKQRSKDRLPGSPQAQKRVIDLIVAGGADSPTFGGRDGKAIKESGEPETIAAAYLAIWRGEWGDDWLRDNLSVHAVVDRLDGFKLWQREQAPPVPATAAASRLTPATSDDLAIWDRARTDLAGLMNAANFTAYIEPLTIGGRLESGALCVIVPSAVAPSVARFRGAIAKTLIDAGDAAGAAVAFKARRPMQEQQHAE